jgi:rare lipoprotein A
MLVLCAFTAPLLILAGCSATTSADPKLGAAASAPAVAAAEEPVSDAEAQKEGNAYKVAGKTRQPGSDPTNYSAEGLASWYGSMFHGRKTANGEVFDKDSLSAAHPTLPLPSYARVTNVGNGKSIVVRVNDRGPYHGGRVLDVSQKVAHMLDFENDGMARVRIDYVGPASLEGSDDAKLMATYREKGAPTTAIAGLQPQRSDIAGLYKDPGQQRLAAAHQIRQGTPEPALQRALAQAAKEAEKPAKSEQPAEAPQVADNATTTPQVDVASRIQTGFNGISSPQPLTQQRGGGMVSPVLSGFAFNPTANSFR